MKSFNIILSAVLGALLVCADPEAVSKTLQAGNTVYSIVDLTWNLEINETLTVPVTGTVQDVYKVLAEYDPAGAAAMNATIAPSKTELAPRSDQTYTPTKSYCDIFSDAKCDAINNGISYLSKVLGSPSEGPGPGACARVSCSYKSAIWWCNDDAQDLTLNGFDDIARGAQKVMNDCSFEPKDGVCHGDIKFNGQQFYSGGWNVIVDGATC